MSLCRKLPLFSGKSTKVAAATGAAFWLKVIHQIVCRLGLCFTGGLQQSTNPIAGSEMWPWKKRGREWKGVIGKASGTKGKLRKREKPSHFNRRFDAYDCSTCGQQPLK